MSGRAGGTAKPLKAPKRKPKEEDDPDDDAFKAKQKADAIALKAAKLGAAKSGPLSIGNTGIKKSGKK